MIERKSSLSRLLSSASMSRFGKEETGKEPLVVSATTRLPRRRTSTVRVTFNGDSSDSEQHSPTFRPSTTTSSSAKLHYQTSKTGLRSLDSSSNSSLRSKRLSEIPPLSARPKNTFRSKAPKPLKLDERAIPIHIEPPPSSRETTTSSYDEQFRRRRGDLLHRSGPSVPYMQAYDPTSLQW